MFEHVCLRSLLLKCLTVHSAMIHQSLLQSMDHAAILPLLQCFLQQQQQSRPHLQAQRSISQDEPATTTSLIAASDAASTPCDHLPSRKIITSKRNQVKRRQLQLVSVWLGKAWQMQTMRAEGSWTYCFRTWNVLANSAPILKCVLNDDLLGFQQLITSGGFTYNDRDRFGETLLEVSTCSY